MNGKMMILDTLFKVCFAPFQQVDNGRAAAIIWLVHILGFSGVALFNAVFFWLGINLSSPGIAMLGAMIGIGIYFLFDRIYIKDNRGVGLVKYPFFMGVLVFMLLIGSLVLMIFSLARY